MKIDFVIHLQNVGSASACRGEVRRTKTGADRNPAGTDRLSINPAIPLVVLPLDGGGLPAFGGAEGDQGFGWG